MGIENGRIVSQDENKTELHRIQTTEGYCALFKVAFLSFCCLLAGVFVRFVFLEWTYGDTFRTMAARPLRKEIAVGASRGRILSAEGVILAEDRLCPVVAIEYRYLESPPNERWLNREIRRRLDTKDRGDPRCIATARRILLAERTDLHAKLAAICNIPQTEWDSRCRRIQIRVERISDAVNRRNTLAADSNPSKPVPPRRIIVAEETRAHPVVWDVSEKAAAKIEAARGRFPGVEIWRKPRRTYPTAVAPHLVGHLGAVREEEFSDEEGISFDTRVGRMGVELQYEGVLRGRRGVLLRETDRKGRLNVERTLRPAVPGRDVRLTLRFAIARAAQTLLDDAIARRDAMSADSGRGGGAIVIMDVRTGAIIAAASAPRFDPNVFERGDPGPIRELTSSLSAPLFDRVCRMQLPPGSVFKIVTAAALLEEATVDPRAPHECRGFLHEPNTFRCAIFTRLGIGHGAVALDDALVKSCNVYFFHWAESLKTDPLRDWALRFGLGEPTGVDLPSEASGNLPISDETASPRMAAVGQGSVTATPLQIARLAAAIANGGHLVNPRVVIPERDEMAAAIVSRSISGLAPDTVDFLQDALRRVVSDPEGTAYAVLNEAPVPVAAKTGTAQTAGGPPHAWLAGYAPADSPRYAFAVVLEHAGDAAEAAGPVVERLIRVFRREGYAD